MIRNRTRPEINQYVACAGDWRASIMMLDISWKGSASEVPRTIAVVSGDPELDSTWKAIAYVSSLCVVGAVGSVRHFRVPCEAHHIPLVHSVFRISPPGPIITRACAENPRPPSESVAGLRQPRIPRLLMPELLGTAKGERP